MVQIIACFIFFSTDWNTAVPLLMLSGHTGLADPPQVRTINQNHPTELSTQRPSILDVPLHVQCQVIRTGETPEKRTQEEDVSFGCGNILQDCWKLFVRVDSH